MKKYDKEEFLLAVHEHFAPTENKRMRKVHAIRGNMSGWQQFEAAKIGGRRGGQINYYKHKGSKTDVIHSRD